ncbi:flagellar basal body-associated FliL family protein [Pseudooctadecabacter jejudonensis]|uniref:Flagellar protein FliL n=1 Tax=Pseudooctadecabacter jejudonensis TaxID=1391910 RepID=A0A1Y5S4D5_9RHOB|nr:flagellar basal body-associated FliL family protein [Pseudooctadecabacter jejudonensis]SLN32104.1 Flagellar FliL protein [Pseudooctadecabacter jejudonensis]
MAEDPINAEETDGSGEKKGSKLPLILGFVLALAGGGGAFFAVQSGLLSGGSDTEEMVEVDEVEPLDTPTFIPMETLVINLPDGSDAKHLLFTAELEVDPAHGADVQAIMPRIVDVLNGYLRAVRLSELEDPTALIRLRAQMLRRVQVVAGEGRIKDVLIKEFVLN